MNKISCWNVRGFNQPFKSKEMKKLIRENNIGLCGIIETRVAKHRVGDTFNKFFRRWDWFSNVESCLKNCRIVVGWDPNSFEVMHLFETDQVIHCLVKQKCSQEHFFCSFVYAANDHIPRRLLWHSLVVFKLLVNDFPWVILGDFNAMLREDESAGGRVGRSPAIYDFCACVAKIEVEDLHYSGMKFTWSGSPHGVGEVRKLDRVLVNAGFLSKFRNAKARFLAPNSSDHSPAILDTGGCDVVKRRASFKFQNFLVYRTNFLDLVRKGWNVNDGGVMMYRVVQKLKRLKTIFKFEAKASGNLCSAVKDAQLSLQNIQLALDCDPFNEFLKSEEVIWARKYREASLEEERMLKQRSKIHWLKVGDHNNQFFHKSLQVRRNRNRISSICNDQGIEVEGDLMIQQFVSFYTKLLGTKSESENIDSLADGFEKKVHAALCAEMVQIVTEEEIKAVIFAMGDDKASGPDGFSAKFFKAAWPLIGDDVCRAVKEFFTSGKLLKEINATIIALIPKVAQPRNVSEFRPISLCNVLYKCISKILANRIKSCLHVIVDDNQNAFIPGRRISDNILLTQELFRDYHRQEGLPRCAFKVDIRKAYDSVNWDFLFSALRLFGFPDRMVGWIQECVSTPCYSIIVNGETHGFFKAQKGLRQGDPLSPYLFTLVMQVLTIMLKKRISEDRSFKFHAKCENLGISHLCFADDLFLFSHGDPWSVQILKDSLDEFGAASGLWPNEEKSNVFYCQVSNENKMLINNIMRFEVGCLPVNYLGVPLVTTRLWHADCSSLIDQVKGKIQQWQNNWLTYAGRLQLALSVLMSMQVYWSSVFILPVSVSNAIERLVRNFIWGGTEMVQSRSKVRWYDVCMPKSEGGLGIRSLRSWNKTLMAYHIWSNVTNRDSLWVKWVHTYRLKGKNFWQVKVPWNASISWKRILGIREDFRKFFVTDIGNGSDTSFWYDNWTGEGPLCSRVSPRDIARMGYEGRATVSDLVVDGQVVFPNEVLISWPELTGKLFFTNENRKDRISWRSNNGKKSMFKTSTVWNDFKIFHPQVEWSNLVWFSNAIPKHSFILWLAIRGKLLTQDRMQLWQSESISLCAFCNLQPDSIEHLFFECCFCKEVSDYFSHKGVIIPTLHSWADLVGFASSNWSGNSLLNVVNKLVLGGLVYFIWQERNCRLFQKKFRSVNQVIGCIEETIRLKILGLKIRNSSRVFRTLRLWNISWKVSLPQNFLNGLGLLEDL